MAIGYNEDMPIPQPGIFALGTRSHVHIEFDLVVTVCDNARESCPVFPGNVRGIHQSFDDPPALAREANSPEEELDHYRRVRDEIRGFVERI